MLQEKLVQLITILIDGSVDILHIMQLLAGMEMITITDNLQQKIRQQLFGLIV